MKSRLPPCRQHAGFSLVELMIGMTLGLVLLLALSYFFLGSRQTSRSHDDVSRMQENARYVLETLGKAVRQAGYRSDYTQKFSATALAGSDGAGGAADTLTVRHDAQGGGERDCTGATVSSGVVTYQFSVSSAYELRCSNGSSTVIVADNVENLQITYGIDVDRNGVVESYQSASGVSDFGQVAVVKVVLTMRGPSNNAATGGDGHLRQTYYSSYVIRNQAG